MTRLAVPALLAAGLCACGSGHAVPPPAAVPQAPPLRPLAALPAPSSRPAAPKPLPRRPSRVRPGPLPALVRHGPRSRREVALTFDADMTQPMLAAVRAGHRSIGYDPRIVAELRASRTPATIFMTGLWPTAHPIAARELAHDPLFEIENHSWDHAAFARPCYGLPRVPAKPAKAAEIGRAAQVLTRLTGAAPHYFRFPGGCHRRSDLRLVAALGERAVQWDVVSGDAYLRDPAAVARATLNGVRPGSIVVLHLVGAPNAPATADALRTILPGLRAKGLRPVKLGRLLRRR